jgi:hypothetical protein
LADFLLDLNNRPTDNAIGTIAGFPAYISEHIGSGTYFFGNFEKAALGFFGAMEVSVDPFYDYQKGNVGVRAILDFDFQGGGFAVLSVA